MPPHLSHYWDGRVPASPIPLCPEIASPARLETCARGAKPKR